MINTTSLSEQIEAALVKEILAGEHAPGERLPIEDLAMKWGISVTPVRDAVRALESKGFVTVEPRKGVFIAKLDYQMFKEIFEIRIALECMAVELATPNIPQQELEALMRVYDEAEARLQVDGDRSLLVKYDHRLHDLIIGHCGNGRLIEIMETLSSLIQWAISTIVTRYPNSYAITLPEHRRICQALLERDSEAAFFAMRSHLKNALQRASVDWGQG